MELIGGLIGAGLVAVAPMVPGLRPVAKALVKGGMAVAGVTVAVAAVVTEQVSDLMAHARTQPESETIVEGEAVATAEAVASEPEMPAADVPPTASATPAADLPAGQTAAGVTALAGLRPLAKASVKGGIALADGAKGAAGAAVGAAAVVGQKLGGLAAHRGRVTPAESTAAGDDVTMAAASTAGAEVPVDTTAAGGDAAAAGEPDIPTPSAVSQPVTVENQPAPDDLLRIKGVGPKTAGLLEAAGITTFAQLAVTPVDQLQAILQQAGGRYRIVDPTSWPAQAQEMLATPAHD